MNYEITDKDIECADDNLYIDILNSFFYELDKWIKFETIEIFIEKLFTKLESCLDLNCEEFFFENSINLKNFLKYNFDISNEQVNHNVNLVYSTLIFLTEGILGDIIGSYEDIEQIYTCLKSKLFTDEYNIFERLQEIKEKINVCKHVINTTLLQINIPITSELLEFLYELKGSDKAVEFVKNFEKFNFNNKDEFYRSLGYLNNEKLMEVILDNPKSFKEIDKKGPIYKKLLAISKAINSPPNASFEH